MFSTGHLSKWLSTELVIPKKKLSVELVINLFRLYHFQFVSSFCPTDQEPWTTLDIGKPLFFFFFFATFALICQSQADGLVFRVQIYFAHPNCCPDPRIIQDPRISGSAIASEWALPLKPSKQTFMKLGWWHGPSWDLSVCLCAVFWSVANSALQTTMHSGQTLWHWS